LAAGPALVPEADGEAGFVFEFFGEFAGVVALAAGFAGHVHGIADEDHFDTALEGEFAEDFDVVAAADAFEGFESLSGDAELVAEGEADAFFAEVERQDAP
jgi:hypothetical protein